MAVTHEQKLSYAGIYVLKKMDLKPADGGIALPVIMDALLSPLEEVVERLVMQGHLAIDRKTQPATSTRCAPASCGAGIRASSTTWCSSRSAAASARSSRTGRPSSPATNSTPTSTSTSSAAAATTTTIELRGCSRPRR